jgi:hypothetical protein
MAYDNYTVSRFMYRHGPAVATLRQYLQCQLQPEAASRFDPRIALVDRAQAAAMVASHLRCDADQLSVCEALTSPEADILLQVVGLFVGEEIGLVLDVLHDAADLVCTSQHLNQESSLGPVLFFAGGALLLIAAALENRRRDRESNSSPDALRESPPAARLRTNRHPELIRAHATPRTSLREPGDVVKRSPSPLTTPETPTSFNIVDR